MSREIKLDEIKGHNNEDSAWVIIHNDIYDLTKFLEEHPGGAESILEYAGKDGTQAFEDVAHSQDARELMVKFKIGTLPEDQRIDEKCYKTKTKKKHKSSSPTPQLNKDVIVLAATSSPYTRDVKREDARNWRPYDAKEARSSSANPKLDSRAPPDPHVERCHDYFYKPHDRPWRRPAPPPRPSSQGGTLKWAIMALAGALIIGVVIRKCLK